mgnify:CR=1 FL=1
MNREKVMTFMKKSLRFLPDKAYIKLYYRLRVGRKLNTHDPETLNEKLQWLKFNYRFPLQSIVSDKLLVRDYVKEKIGEEYLIPLLGSWEKYSDIDFSSLPKRFVLKCNHDSGGLVVCTDKDKMNYEEAKKRDIAKAEITDEEMHVLCTIFWTSVYEPFIHEMSWKEIEEHCKVVCRFMDWKNAVGIMD